MTDDYTLTGRRFQKLRQLAGRSQVDVAEAIGISERHLQRIEAEDQPLDRPGRSGAVTRGLLRWAKKLEGEAS